MVLLSSSTGLLGEATPELRPSDALPSVAGPLGAFPASVDAVPVLGPLTFRDDFPDATPLRRLALPNQWGNPWRRLNPPGGSRSSSVALTGSSLAELVLNVYVVRGTINGWKTSVAKVTSGGRSG